MHHIHICHHNFSPRTFNYLMFSKTKYAKFKLLKRFLQMVNHVAPWEDEEGWTHSNCPNGYNFPDVICHLSRYLGYPQCSEYITKMVTESEEQVHQVFIYLTPHPDRVHMFQETNPTLREAYEAVALAALTELCERHAVAPLLINPTQMQSSCLIRTWNLLALQTD